MNKQLVAARLAALYGVKVRVGLRRWLEDVYEDRDFVVRIGDNGLTVITEKRPVLVGQIPRDDGEVFEREDGAPVPQTDIDAATAFVEANPPPAPAPRRDVDAELGEAQAAIAALLKKGIITRSEIDDEKGAVLR